ncbi:hypothetical protein HDU92_000004 [Lobulomyces angularis]|nr:hypothetical protein HDU92_000004 [Lobulomyces angularis]
MGEEVSTSEFQSAFKEPLSISSPPQPSDTHIPKINFNDTHGHEKRATKKATYTLPPKDRLALRKRERNYDLNLVMPVNYNMPPYEPLLDEYLEDYFESKQNKKHLLKLGLIDKQGHLVDAKTFKYNQIRLDKKEYETKILKLHDAKELDRDIEVKIFKDQLLKPNRSSKFTHLKQVKNYFPYPDFLSSYPITMYRTAILYSEGAIKSKLKAQKLRPHARVHKTSYPNVNEFENEIDEQGCEDMEEETVSVADQEEFDETFFNANDGVEWTDNERTIVKTMAGQIRKLGGDVYEVLPSLVSKKQSSGDQALIRPKSARPSRTAQFPVGEFSDASSASAYSEDFNKQEKSTVDASTYSELEAAIKLEAAPKIENTEDGAHPYKELAEGSTAHQSNNPENEQPPSFMQETHENMSCREVDSWEPEKDNSSNKFQNEAQADSTFEQTENQNHSKKASTHSLVDPVAMPVFSNASTRKHSVVSVSEILPKSKTMSRAMSSSSISSLQKKVLVKNLKNSQNELRKSNLELGSQSEIKIISGHKSENMSKSNSQDNFKNLLSKTGSTTSVIRDVHPSLESSVDQAAENTATDCVDILLSLEKSMKVETSQSIIEENLYETDTASKSPSHANSTSLIEEEMDFHHSPKIGSKQPSHVESSHSLHQILMNDQVRSSGASKISSRVGSSHTLPAPFETNHKNGEEMGEEFSEVAQSLVVVSNKEKDLTKTTSQANVKSAKNSNQHSKQVSENKVEGKSLSTSRTQSQIKIEKTLSKSSSKGSVTAVKDNEATISHSNSQRSIKNVDDQINNEGPVALSETKSKASLRDSITVADNTIAKKSSEVSLRSPQTSEALISKKNSSASLKKSASRESTKMPSFDKEKSRTSIKSANTDHDVKSNAILSKENSRMSAEELKNAAFSKKNSSTSLKKEATDEKVMASFEKEYSYSSIRNDSSNSQNQQSISKKNSTASLQKSSSQINHQNPTPLSKKSSNRSITIQQDSVSPRHSTTLVNKTISSSQSRSSLSQEVHSPLSKKNSSVSITKSLSAEEKVTVLSKKNSLVGVDGPNFNETSTTLSKSNSNSGLSMVQNNGSITKTDEEILPSDAKSRRSSSNSLREKQGSIKSASRTGSVGAFAKSSKGGSRTSSRLSLIQKAYDIHPELPNSEKHSRRGSNKSISQKEETSSST